MKSLLAGAVFSIAGMAVGRAAPGADLAPNQVGVVSHIKVVSDKVPDVSSLEAWKKSTLKEGMSDKEKALAIFNTMVAFQNADGPPHEYVLHEDEVLDPLKMFNVYGYGYCSVSSANTAALARAAGLKCRNATIMNHVVPELYYDGGWHLLDADLIEYFPKADGTISSLQEVVDGVRQWEKDHPDFPVALPAKKARYKYMNEHGWKTGPEILQRNPFYDDAGWLPDHDFAWGDTMQQFSKMQNNYESGYSLGYQVNIELRPGEKLTRNWSNKGLWANMDGGKTPQSMKETVGKGSLAYSVKWGDLAPGRIGNGVLEYQPPLSDPVFLRTALAAENLAVSGADKNAPALHVADPAKDAVLEIRMPSSYVYLTGSMEFKAVVGQGGEIKVLFSDNNGLDWKEKSTITTSGDQKVDLSKEVIRKYDYRLRFVMKGAGAGLDSLKITHDVQQSQRALPALAQGDNVIQFSAGPNESTISYEASTYAAKNKGKAVTYEDLHAKVTNNNESNANQGRLMHNGTEPTLVDFPVTTPAEMKRLRIFGFYRTGSPKNDVWNVSVSFDGGKSFKALTSVDSVETPFNQIQVTSDVPAGTRDAIVRYSGAGPDTSLLLNFRIDADYTQPAAGFRPVNVTYVWEEDGKEKTDKHGAVQPSESYTIHCDKKPVMKSVVMELAN